MKSETNIDYKDRILDMISKEVKENIEEKNHSDDPSGPLNQDALLYIRF